MFLKESFCINAAVATTFNVNLPKAASCFFSKKRWLEEGRGVRILLVSSSLFKWVSFRDRYPLVNSCKAYLVGKSTICLCRYRKYWWIFQIAGRKSAIFCKKKPVAFDISPSASQPTPIHIWAQDYSQKPTIQRVSCLHSITH